ncbi:hypothetical protein LX32DRAFT_114288 [Colletotrichum zoysiae]|uniref:Secreted protein n=1 Tax=Colletotrichum zoysiae TaxID=1216348 RepID=A0AAD9H9Q6_9PEZI|nr:hypothetical protein LX32DRAFT_114288 [Colletotrichum zoysiae]
MILLLCVSNFIATIVYQATSRGTNRLCKLYFSRSLDCSYKAADLKAPRIGRLGKKLASWKPLGTSGRGAASLVTYSAPCSRYGRASAPSVCAFLPRSLNLVNIPCPLTGDNSEAVHSGARGEFHPSNPDDHESFAQGG